MNINKGVVQLLFGAVCISFAPIFVKLLGLDLMTPTSIGFWRTLFGAAMLFLLAISRGRRPTINKQILGWAVLAGFLFSVDLFFWHRSIVYAGAGMATILANTQVFGTAILGYFVFRNLLTIRFFAAAVAALAGVALLVGVGSDIDFNSTYLRGIFFGLITGLAYAHYLVTLKYAGHKQELPDFLVLMAWVSLFCAIFLGCATVAEGHGTFPPDLYSLLILLALALVAQSLGWWALSSGLSKVEASRAGLIILLQPVLATVWGVIFFAESLALFQLIGALITLSAIYVGGMKRKLDNRPAAP